MKIRIRGNSIRYRVTRSEVEQFAAEGYLKETTDFGHSQLTFALASTPTEKMSATFHDSVITVFVPHQKIQAWSGSDLVGLNENVPVGDTSALYLLLEKDFKCIDEDAKEDQSDYFENPVKAC